jgi:probable rRNA maturation factor
VKLALLDRRPGPDGTSRVFHGGAWDRLVRLADGLGVPTWRVNVVLVDDELMAGLNRDFRHGDGVTDVLTFTYLEEAGAGPPSLAAGERSAARDLWRPATLGEDAVGELVLAPAFVARRCAENGWPLADEIPMLVVHGCLHLLGWTHADETESAAMQDLEEAILAGEGLSHPLRGRS